MELSTQREVDQRSKGDGYREEEMGIFICTPSLLCKGPGSMRLTHTPLVGLKFQASQQLSALLTRIYYLGRVR